MLQDSWHTRKWILCEKSKSNFRLLLRYKSTGIEFSVLFLCLAVKELNFLKGFFLFKVQGNVGSYGTHESNDDHVADRGCGL